MVKAIERVLLASSTIILALGLWNVHAQSPSMLGTSPPPKPEVKAPAPDDWKVSHEDSTDEDAPTVGPRDNIQVIPPDEDGRDDSYEMWQRYRQDVTRCRGTLGIISNAEQKRRFGDRWTIVMKAAKGRTSPNDLPYPPQSYVTSMRQELRARAANSRCANGVCRIR